ncbi:MAG: ATP-binding cassette domain-containing protein [Clostridia bacterium]|nr:ATP-binding cassette domain-containing protein [Clostridia bacterium]MDH7572123.1 ATP-binding cassette domain-containing protein [Clostridia bacterium]
MALFAIEDLSYWYPQTDRPALAGISLTIEEGEMVVLAGGSGSGKSTLARLLAGLSPRFYGGRQQGRVLFRGKDLRALDPRYLAGRVGLVFQDPEKQLVMTSVEAEIVFGPENLGLPPSEIGRRLAEVTGFLGLTHLKGEFTGNLSGGQKQKLALAAVLAMQPEVLILDEPTSQLDPVAAEEFLHLVERLNREMGCTVVLVEHRLERCLHLADRLVVLEGGKIVACAPPADLARRQDDRLLPFLPPVTRLFAALGAARIPLTVKEARRELPALLSRRPEPGSVPDDNPFPSPGATGIAVQRYAVSCDSGGGEDAASPSSFPDRQPPGLSPVLAELHGVWFAYPNGHEALKDVGLVIRGGELTALLGENAAGKTTLLKLIAGLLRPARGKVRTTGEGIGLAAGVAYLSQDPNDYLFRDTVEEELAFTLSALGRTDNGAVAATLDRLGLASLRHRYPRELSAGERQRVALALLLVAGPRLLLLDEPTRGMDACLKERLGAWLREIVAEGRGVVLVTHDTEFAARYADRVVMMSDGAVVADGPAAEVLASSLFYCPQIGRLFRGEKTAVLTVEEALRWFGRGERECICGTTGVSSQTT